MGQSNSVLLLLIEVVTFKFECHKFSRPVVEPSQSRLILYVLVNNFSVILGVFYLLKKYSAIRIKRHTPARTRLHDCAVGRVTGVCSYVQKHVIDALEGYSQFLANEVSKV